MTKSIRNQHFALQILQHLGDVVLVSRIRAEQLLYGEVEQPSRRRHLGNWKKKGSILSEYAALRDIAVSWMWFLDLKVSYL